MRRIQQTLIVLHRRILIILLTAIWTVLALLNKYPLFLKPLVQTLCMKDMPAVSHLYHFAAHHRAQTDHAISIPLLLPLCSQIVGTVLLFVDNIFAQNRWKVSLYFLQTEVTSVINSQVIGLHHHRRERVDRVLWISHPSYDASGNHHQSDEQYTSQHSKHDD